MWFIPLDGDRFLVGPMEISRSKKTVRFRRDVMESSARFFMTGRHFDEWIRPGEADIVLESRPVSGHPDRAWVIMAIHPAHYDSWQQMLDGFPVAVSQVTPDGLVFRRRLRWKVDRIPTGCFRYGLTYVSPNGDLLLPGHRITVDGRVIQDGNIDPGFQGAIISGREEIHISDFRIRLPGLQVPIHALPEAKAGCMLCGNGESVQVWMIERKSRDISWKEIPQLYAIDPVSGTGTWMTDITPYITIASTPDGRWAVAKRDYSGCSLIYGDRDRFSVVEGSDAGFWFRELIGLFPAGERELAVLLDSGILFLDDRKITGSLNISTMPGFPLPGAYVSVSRLDQLHIVTEKETPLSKITRLHHRAIMAVSSSRLGGLFLETQLSIRNDIYHVVLFPSMQVIEIIDPPPGHNILDAGENGYLLAIPDGIRRFFLVFLDPSGMEISRICPGENFISNHITVIPVGWKVFLVAVWDDMGWTNGLSRTHLITFDAQGNLLDRLDIGLRPAFIHVIGRRVEGDSKVRIALRFSSRPATNGIRTAPHPPERRVVEDTGVVIIRDDGEIRFIQPV